MILYDATDLSNGLMQQAHIAYKGNNRVPAVGDDKYERYLAIANRLIRMWAKDPVVKWSSLWTEIDLDTVITIDVQAYDFETSVMRVSDNVYLTDGAGGAKVDEYHVYKPQERDIHGSKVCYVTGVAPLRLNFNDDIDADFPHLGKTIQVAVYNTPDALEDETDAIPVDNPDWLVYALAAELARNDPAKEDQFPNLIGLANEEYRRMVDGNILSPYDQTRAAEPRMPAMGESW